MILLWSLDYCPICGVTCAMVLDAVLRRRTCEARLESSRGCAGVPSSGTKSSDDGVHSASAPARDGQADELGQKPVRVRCRARAESALSGLTCGYGGQRLESRLLSHRCALHLHGELSTPAQVRTTGWSVSRRNGQSRHRIEASLGQNPSRSTACLTTSHGPWGAMPQRPRSLSAALRTPRANQPWRVTYQRRPERPLCS
jgi:hypothetical protein